MFLTTSLPACYLLTLLSLVSVRVFAQIEKTCYFPAGNVALNNVPCDPNAEVSSCCSDRSFCLANGLCRVENSDTELDDTVEFARGACTDQSFQDPACFQQCHSCKSSCPIPQQPENRRIEALARLPTSLSPLPTSLSSSNPTR